MITYMLRRLLYMLIMLIMGSLLAFIVITLPPGDYLTSYIQQLKSSGQDVSHEQELALRRQYGLDYPLPVQYVKWITQLLQGNMGRSFLFSRQVNDIIGERLPATILISVATMIITYAIAIPIGVYSAVRQYSVFDYAFTVFGFIGVSVPDFLLALVLMVFAYRNFNVSIGGLYSPKFLDQPWSAAKVVDFLRHLPVPLLVISLSGTAWLIRVMRAMLLDELPKAYVQTARAKGLPETRLLVKYPIRVALNPIASTVGWALPALFSGQTIISIVLDLPTVGAVLFRSLMTEDMFLASSAIFISTALTLVGTLISDILIAVLDPRIRLA